MKTCLTFRIKAYTPSDRAPYMRIRGYKDQLAGLTQALKDKAYNTSGRTISYYQERGKSESFIDSWHKAVIYIGTVKKLIYERQSAIRANALLLNDNSSLPLATAILAKVVVLVLVTLSNILKSPGL